MTLVIGIGNGDWGNCRSLERIRDVCLLVAHCFDPAIAEKFLEPIRVEPTRHLDDPPLARHERIDTGQIVIEMAIRGPKWNQLVYQFAHEFCHVLANFRRPKVHPMAWFEESLCETSSLFALRAVARTWREAPPDGEEASYADHLSPYASDLLAKHEHQLPASEAFAEWLPRLLPSLEKDPVRRADNTIIASHLLPIFEADPEAWRAVRYLNLWSAKKDVPLDKYFDTWRSVTPVQHHAAVTRIEHCLVSR